MYIHIATYIYTQFHMVCCTCWVHTQVARDPRFVGLRVLVSDASEPAEGEHKVMRLIRSLRAHAGYDPATRHCVYGQVRVCGTKGSHSVVLCAEDVCGLEFWPGLAWQATTAGPDGWCVCCCGHGNKQQRGGGRGTGVGWLEDGGGSGKAEGREDWKVGHVDHAAPCCAAPTLQLYCLCTAPAPHVATAVPHVELHVVLPVVPPVVLPMWQDADLLLLALLSHEPNFVVLREASEAHGGQVSV